MSSVSSASPAAKVVRGTCTLPNMHQYCTRTDTCFIKASCIRTEFKVPYFGLNLKFWLLFETNQHICGKNRPWRYCTDTVQLGNPYMSFVHVPYLSIEYVFPATLPAACQHALTPGNYPPCSKSVPPPVLRRRWLVPVYYCGKRRRC